MTTNKEYLNELASRGDGSLQAWFDSEHVEDANGTLDALSDGLDAKSGDCTDSRELTDAFMEHVDYTVTAVVIDGAYFADSREKLEADVRDHFWHNDWCRTDMVLEWLDRQAAITERETIKSEYKALRKENDELRAKVKELTADLKDEGRTVNELGDENLALKADNELLLDANARLQRALAETREKLGAAIDHAHAIWTLVDLDGGLE